MRTLNNLSYVPQISGELIYHDGFPFPQQKMRIEGRLLHEYITEYYLAVLDKKELPEQTLEILINWCIYYINAPVFSEPGTFENYDKWREKALSLETLQDFEKWLTEGLNYGHDIC